MRIPILALSAVAVSLAMGTSSIAAPEPKRGNADLKKYCSGDAVTYCSGNDPDSPAMDACFQKNMDSISENCRRAIQAYKGK